MQRQKRQKLGRTRPRLKENRHAEAQLQGVVVSDKQDKTVVVKVERRFTHPVLKKTVRRTKNYHAHDEDNAAKVGDIVTIEESRPYSKLKTWILVQGGAGESTSWIDKVKALVGLRKRVESGVARSIEASFPMMRAGAFVPAFEAPGGVRAALGQSQGQGTRDPRQA